VCILKDCENRDKKEVINDPCGEDCVLQENNDKCSDSCEDQRFLLILFYFHLYDILILKLLIYISVSVFIFILFYIILFYFLFIFFFFFYNLMTISFRSIEDGICIIIPCDERTSIKNDVNDPYPCGQDCVLQEDNDECSDSCEDSRLLLILFLILALFHISIFILFLFLFFCFYFFIFYFYFIFVWKLIFFHSFFL
jgi:hypothetical protein